MCLILGGEDALRVGPALIHSGRAIDLLLFTLRAL